MSEAAGILDRFVGDVSKKSATKQILIGAGSGWATGYITMKVGKMAAIAVGGGIILLQVANQQGYIQIDWNKINKKVDKVTDKVEEAVTGQGPSWADKVLKVAKENSYLATGFLGGFLIGMASS